MQSVYGYLINLEARYPFEQKMDLTEIVNRIIGATTIVWGVAWLYFDYLDHFDHKLKLKKLEQEANEKMPKI